MCWKIYCIIDFLKFQSVTNQLNLLKICYNRLQQLMSKNCIATFFRKEQLVQRPKAFFPSEQTNRWPLSHTS